MLLHALRLFALLTVLLPGAWYAWQWRAMPHASEYHDDGLYFVGAKSLAESSTYSIESLPANPAQTKYPPLWPAILSLAWLVEPHFPDNLLWAMALCWIWLPLSLFAYRQWLLQAGLSPNVVLGLGLLWAANPYVILFSSAMLSEMNFTFLLLACLVCLPKEKLHWAAVAGILAGLAFLSRTAAIALLPAAVAVYLLRERWKHAAIFAASMLPAILGWVIWSAGAKTKGFDLLTLYYTNYFGFYRAVFEWKEVHLYVWKNLDGLLHGLGALLLPDVTQSLFDKVLAETLGIAGIVGIIRLLREDRRSPYTAYAIFSAVYALILIIWPFPPTERLMLPVVPLWLAGLYLELRRLAMNILSVFRKPETSQKVAGAVITALLSLTLLYCGYRQWNLLTNGLPQFYEDHASRIQRSEPAMQWIRANLPTEARVLSANDPLLYLRTGRRGAAIIQNTIHWYREDHAARTADYIAAPAYAQKHRLEYLLLNDWDYSRDMPTEEHAKLIQSLRANPSLELLFSSGPSQVYRFR